MRQTNDDRGTGRTEAFSDGVIAVAITLLILDIHVPNVNKDLLQALLSQWPTITICSGISSRSITLYC